MLKKQLDYTGNPGSRSKKHCTAGEDICTNRKMQIGHGNDAGRIFGLSINEPEFQSVDNRVAAQMTIDFEVEIIQAEEQRCKIEISLCACSIPDATASASIFQSDSNNFLDAFTDASTSCQSIVLRALIYSCATSLFGIDTTSCSLSYVKYPR